MTPSQITRTINWIAMPIALVVLGLVSLHIYQQHFLPVTDNRQYQFDDLPTQNTDVVTADIDAIIQNHVFGQQPEVPKTPSKPVVNKPTPKPAPKTRLNLKLTGVICTHPLRTDYVQPPVREVFIGVDDHKVTVQKDTLQIAQRLHTPPRRRVAVIEGVVRRRRAVEIEIAVIHGMIVRDLLKGPVSTVDQIHRSKRGDKHIAQENKNSFQ